MFHTYLGLLLQDDLTTLKLESEHAISVFSESSLKVCENATSP